MIDIMHTYLSNHWTNKKLNREISKYLSFALALVDVLLKETILCVKKVTNVRHFINVLKKRLHQIPIGLSEDGEVFLGGLKETAKIRVKVPQWQ